MLETCWKRVGNMLGTCWTHSVNILETCCKHVGHPDTPCGICGHGACWHRLDISQFDSPRDSAHKPRYIPLAIAIFVPTLPQVPPLPEITPRFCRGELPV